MAKQEIILKGLDGHEDHLVYDATNGQVGDSLEECARSLFPKEGETSPRLRFKGFEGEWVSTKLCEISKKVTTKNTDLKYKTTLTNSAEFGIVNQLDFFDHDISNGDNIRGYFVVEPDDFVYNPRISVTAPVGPINRNQLGYAGVMSPLYYVFRVEGIDLDYLSYYFKTKLWHKFMYDNGNSGARFDRFSISDEVFGQMPILHPSDIEEQKVIAAFFRRLDSQIALRKNQYERLLQVKSACLESMFPKHSENTPPIRFNGYEGKWVRSLLGDIFKERTESNINGEMLSVTMNQGIIKASENGRFDNSNSDKSHYKVVKVNDIAYNSMRMWQGASGRSPYEGIVSPAYTVVFPVEGIDSEFFAYLFKTSDMINLFKLNSQGLTSDNWNLKFPAFSKIEAIYPKNIEEQKQIASFFRRIDSRITTEQKGLERLKQMKSACLRSMFPQNGGGILPAIRFKGYNGVWITKSFTDIFVFLKNNSLSRAELDLTGTVMNVHYGDILVKFGDLIDMSKEALPYIKNDSIAASLADSCRLQNGDIVFADAAEDNTVGKCAEIISINNKDVVSGLHTIPCRPGTGVFAEGFLGYCLNAPSFHDQLLPMIQGTKISSISKKALSSTFITYPSDIDEQRHIASFFRSLDTKILLQTQRIEKLKQMKAACLNKMIA